MILARVFRSGPVTRDRILGAVAAYLLFGLTWASAYHLLAVHLPGAFSGVAPDRTDPWPTWVYFSFVTLTTVGYGDRFPVTPLGRTTAVALMFAGIGVIGALASILASLLVSPAPPDAEDEAPAAGASATAPVVVAPSIEAELAATRSELGQTRTELDRTRAEMAELRRLIASAAGADARDPTDQA
jgi:hypothetical protein